MNKKGMFRGALVKIIIMLLLIGIIIIFLGQGYSKMVIVAIDLGIIKQSEITESVEAGVEEEGTDITAANKKAWETFVKDMKFGYKKCIGQSGTNPDMICRCDIDISMWPSNAGEEDGYLFRLKRNPGYNKNGIDAVGFKAPYNYELLAKEQIAPLETINENLVPCTVSSLKDFKMGSPRYNLNILENLKINMFRRSETGDEVGIIPDNGNEAVLMNTDLHNNKKIYTLMKFDNKRLCFVTYNGMTNTFWQDVGNLVSGHDSERERAVNYLFNMQYVPKCSEPNCWARNCNNMNTESDCIKNNDCCTWDKNTKKCDNDCDKLTAEDCTRLGEQNCKKHQCCEFSISDTSTGCTHITKGEGKTKETMVFNHVLDELEYGFNQCESITKGRAESDGICRCDIPITEWNYLEGKDLKPLEHYIFRIEHTDTGAEIKAYVGTELSDIKPENQFQYQIFGPDYGHFVKKSVLEKAPTREIKLFPCVTTTFEKFDENDKQNFGLKYMKDITKFILVRRDNELFFNSEGTYFYPVGSALKSDSKISIIRRTKDRYCFMIGRDQDYNSGGPSAIGSGVTDGTFEEYEEKLAKIPSCGDIHKQEWTNPIYAETEEELNCAMSICGEVDTSEECYEMAPCCTWGDSPYDEKPGNICYDEISSL